MLTPSACQSKAKQKTALDCICSLLSAIIGTLICFTIRIKDITTWPRPLHLARRWSRCSAWRSQTASVDRWYACAGSSESEFCNPHSKEGVFRVMLRRISVVMWTGPKRAASASWHRWTSQRSSLLGSGYCARSACADTANGRGHGNGFRMWRQFTQSWSRYSKENQLHLVSVGIRFIYATKMKTFPKKLASSTSGFARTPPNISATLRSSHCQAL